MRSLSLHPLSSFSIPLFDSLSLSSASRPLEKSAATNRAEFTVSYPDCTGTLLSESTTREVRVVISLFTPASEGPRADRPSSCCYTCPFLAPFRALHAHPSRATRRFPFCVSFFVARKLDSSSFFMSLCVSRSLSLSLALALSQSFTIFLGLPSLSLYPFPFPFLSLFRSVHRSDSLTRIRQWHTRVIFVRGETWCVRVLYTQHTEVENVTRWGRDVRVRSRICVRVLGKTCLQPLLSEISRIRARPRRKGKKYAT